LRRDSPQVGISFQLSSIPIAVGDMLSLHLLEQPKQVFCLSCQGLMAVPLQLSDDFALTSNVPFAFGDMLFRLRQARFCLSSIHRPG
jgi:hypothetical protein